MNVQTNEIRELTDHELDSVAGGSPIHVGHAIGEFIEWLTSPGDVKAWEAHLKSIL
jgi:hypothetical protein